MCAPRPELVVDCRDDGSGRSWLTAQQHIFDTYKDDFALDP